MATSRLLQHSKVPFDQLPSSSSSSSYTKCLRYQSRACLRGDNIKVSTEKGERKPVVVMKATMTTSTDHLTISQPALVPEGLSELLAEIIASIRNAMLVVLFRGAVINRRIKRDLHPQMLIEKVLLQFFSLFFFKYFSTAGKSLTFDDISLKNVFINGG